MGLRRGRGGMGGVLAQSALHSAMPVRRGCDAFALRAHCARGRVPDGPAQ